MDFVNEILENLINHTMGAIKEMEYYLS